MAHRSSARPPPDGGRVAARLAAVVTLLLAAVGAVLAYGQGTGELDLLPHRQVTVTVGVSVTADSTGTLVDFVAQSPEGALPDTVDVSLVTADAATAAGGTGGRLVYSDVVDGLGNSPPADQVRSGRLTGVRTDGRRLNLRFHVQSVDGRRVVFPAPVVEGLHWARLQVYSQSSALRCWAAPRDGGVWTACPATQELDGANFRDVRLEVQGT